MARTVKRKRLTQTEKRKFYREYIKEVEESYPLDYQAQLTLFELKLIEKKNDGGEESIFIRSQGGVLMGTGLELIQARVDKLKQRLVHKTFKAGDRVFDHFCNRFAVVIDIHEDTNSLILNYVGTCTITKQPRARYEEEVITYEPDWDDVRRDKTVKRVAYKCQRQDETFTKKFASPEIWVDDN